MSDVIDFESGAIKHANKQFQRFCEAYAADWHQAGKSFERLCEVAESAAIEHFAVTRKMRGDLSSVTEEERAFLLDIQQETTELVRKLHKTPGIGRKRALEVLKLVRFYGRVNALDQEGVTDAVDIAMFESAQFSAYIEELNNTGKIRI